MLYLRASMCIFAIRGWYCCMTCFIEINIFIQLVFTFVHNLFLFFESTSHSLWNSTNILVNEIKTHKTTRVVCKWTTKFNFDKTKTTKLVQWANHKWNHILFHLCNHTKLNSCNVKHITTIIVAHWYEIHSQLFTLEEKHLFRLVSATKF
jgi:hypothetical protein